MIADAAARAADAAARPDFTGFLRRLDLVLLVAAAALVAYGLWAISGITRFDVPGNPDYFVVRQGIAAGLGAVGLVLAIVIPTDVWRRHWRFVYGGTIGLMIFVFVFAEAIRGSKRWIDVGPIQFQPSEFGKGLFVLALAGFLVERRAALGQMRTVLAALALAAVPTALVFLQPDLGTALVYGAAVCAVLFVAGVRWLHLAILAVVGATVVLGVLWFLPAAGVEVLKPYQTARLTGFTNPDADPAGLTYNVQQSITAVGAGGLEGPRRHRGQPDAVRLPAGARHRLRLRVLRRAARLLRRRDPPAPLPARRLARAPGRDRRGRPLRRDGRRRDRVRFPVPGLRQRRDDDGHRARDRHPVAVRHRRRLVDGGQPRRDRAPAGHPCPRPYDRHLAPMKLPLTPRHVLALGRDTQAARAPRPPILVRGVLADQLAAALRAGGDPSLVRTAGDPAAASAVVCVVAGAATPEDERVLRTAARALVPLVAVQTGDPAAPLPYVLATEVVDCRPGAGFPVEEIAQALARVLAPRRARPRPLAARAARPRREPPRGRGRSRRRVARRARPRRLDPAPAADLASADAVRHCDRGGRGAPRGAPRVARGRGPAARALAGDERRRRTVPQTPPGASPAARRGRRRARVARRRDALPPRRRTPP